MEEPFVTRLLGFSGDRPPHACSGAGAGSPRKTHQTQGLQRDFRFQRNGRCS